MSPEPIKSSKYQGGLGLVAAIFVITVMALISVGLSQLVVTGQQAYGFQVLSTRAFLAAESGAQLAANSLLPPLDESSGHCGLVEPNPTLKAAGFQGCRVEVSCSRVGPIEGRLYYTLESEGLCGSGVDLAIRRVAVRIQQPQ